MKRESAFAVIRRIGALVALIVIGIFLLGYPVSAGQQEAGIIGQVTDESGAILPGVTVTATSAALQVPSVTDVTNDRGEYRLTPLPIGSFELVYELSGFQSIKREGVRLTQGFVAKLDVVLKVGSLTETVTVSGASPVVDVTSTKASTQLTRETLEAIPTSRNGTLSLAEQTPGVRANLDSGGTGMSAVPLFRSFAQNGGTWITMDGIVMSVLGDNNYSDYIDYSAIEEGRIDTLGNGADMPTRGIRIESIVKSGSNNFHSNLFWGQTRPAFQSNNIDDDLIAKGLTGQNKVANRFDLSGDLGGKIINDKLWFYEALRARGIDSQVPGVFKEDGSPGIYSQRQYFTTTKVSYQASQRQRFIGVYQWNLKQAIGPSLSTLVPWESRTDQQHRLYVGKIEWQTVHGNSLTTSLQYGFFHPHAPQIGHSTNVPTLDIATRKTSGDSLSDGFDYHEWEHSTRGNIGWFRPNLFYGDHNLKLGGDYIDDSFGFQFLNKFPTYQLIFNNTVPFQIQTFNRPVDPISVVRYLGLYGTDSWTIARRLTLNLGVRYDRSAGIVPAQCREAGPFAVAECYPESEMKVWNTLAPRLHAAYDVRGDGKTVIKGGWGRFPKIRYVGPPETSATNPNIDKRTTWLWHDLNNNRAYEPGESNFDPAGSDYVSITGGSGGTNAIPNPNEIQPRSDELSTSVEHELMPSFAVRLTGIYSRTANPYLIEGVQRPYSVYTIPITRPDPGADNRVGTADDPGTQLTYYEYPTSLRGVANATTHLINPPGVTNTYRSVELAASKRLTHHVAFMASYSATKKHIPLGGVLVSGQGISGNINTSNNDPNTRFNLADNTWEWTIKASGTYVFPYGIVSSANFEQRSGDPYARQVLLTGGVTIPSVVLTVEPLGTHRLENINLLDFRIEKRFSLGGSKQLFVWLNIYNMLNANAATAITTLSGPSYAFPTTILPPRVGEISVSYRF